MPLFYFENATQEVCSVVYKGLKKAIFILARVEATARSLAVWKTGKSGKWLVEINSK